MKNELAKLINDIVKKYKIKRDKESLATILKQNPELIEQIIKTAETNDWVNFSRNTFDGWYCIRSETYQPEYSVYYQERGAVCWDIKKFSDQDSAIASVILESGYLHHR